MPRHIRDDGGGSPAMRRGYGTTVQARPAEAGGPRAVHDTSGVDHGHPRTRTGDGRLPPPGQQALRGELRGSAQGVGLRSPRFRQRRDGRQEPGGRERAPARTERAGRAAPAPELSPRERVAEAVRAHLAGLVQPGVPAGVLATRVVGAGIADALLRGPELAGAIRELSSRDDLCEMLSGVIRGHRQRAIEAARARRDDAEIVGGDTRALDARIAALEDLSPRIAAVTAADAIVADLRQGLQLEVARSLESLGARVTERLEALARPPVAAAVAAAVVAAPELAARELEAMGLAGVEVERLLARGGGERPAELARRIAAEARSRAQAFREAKAGMASLAGDFTLLGPEVRDLVLVPELIALGLDPARFPYHQPRGLLEEVVRDGRRSTGLAELAARVADAATGPAAVVAKLLGVAARTVRATELNRELARVGIGTTAGARLAGLEQGARGLVQVAVDALVAAAAVRPVLARGAVSLERVAPGVASALRTTGAGDLVAALARLAAEWGASKLRTEVLPEPMLLDRAARATAARVAGALLGPEVGDAAGRRVRAILYARTALGLSLIGAPERERVRVALARVLPEHTRAGAEVARPAVEALLATAFGPETAEVVRGDDFEQVLRELLRDAPVRGTDAPQATMDE